MIDFATAYTYLQPTLHYYAYTSRTKVPGYDEQDIYQELCLELWRKLGRIPEDMTTTDYRFSRYFGSVFARRVIGLHRRHTIRSKHIGLDGCYRDILATSLPIFEEFERL